MPQTISEHRANLDITAFHSVPNVNAAAIETCPEPSRRPFSSGYQTSYRKLRPLTIMTKVALTFQYGIFPGTFGGSAVSCFLFLSFEKLS